MLTRVFIAVFAAMLLALQWRLWVASGGVAETHRLRIELASSEGELQQLRGRNAALDAEVRDLKSGGHLAIESRARMRLGMIRPDETFFLVVR